MRIFDGSSKVNRPLLYEFVEVIHSGNEASNDCGTVCSFPRIHLKRALIESTDKFSSTASIIAAFHHFADCLAFDIEKLSKECVGFLA